jgi:hypothetical protein
MGSPRSCLARGYSQEPDDIPGIFTFSFDPFVVSFFDAKVQLEVNDAETSDTEAQDFETKACFHPRSSSLVKQCERASCRSLL